MAHHHDIEIRLARDGDNDAINTGFNDHFLRAEPINVYMKKFKSPFEHRQNVPNHGLTLVAEAVDPITGDRKFAGFLMCEIYRSNCPVNADNFILRTDYRVGYEIYKLIKELDTRFNIFDIYQVREAFDMFILSVGDEFRGRSIGKRLAEAGLELAASQGFQVVFMDCTSFYSASAAKRIGMECIGEISYEAYQRKYGETLFAVTEPHTHLRRFVKLINRKI